MFYVKIENGRAVEVTTEYPRNTEGNWDRSYENRNDWKTMERVEEIAVQLTAKLGRLFIGTDSGPNVSPRYDVIEAPTLGEKVSRKFNGDSYPEGEITKISKSLRRIETSTGVVFFRRRQSGCWSDGTFSMIPGHVSERNPSF